jgi:hypothetical protein
MSANTAIIRRGIERCEIAPDVSVESVETMIGARSFTARSGSGRTHRWNWLIRWCDPSLPDCVPLPSAHNQGTRIAFPGMVCRLVPPQLLQILPREGNVEDPIGPMIGRGRVMRGGSDSYCNRYGLAARSLLWLASLVGETDNPVGEPRSVAQAGIRLALVGQRCGQLTQKNGPA